MTTDRLSPNYALNQKVRYRTPLGVWAPEPMRVIGRTQTEMLEMNPLVQYTLQPWELTGHWMVDRPICHVFEGDLEPWKGDADADA